MCCEWNANEGSFPPGLWTMTPSFTPSSPDSRESLASSCTTPFSAVPLTVCGAMPQGFQRGKAWCEGPRSGQGPGGSTSNNCYQPKFAQRPEPRGGLVQRRPHWPRRWTLAWQPVHPGLVGSYRAPSAQSMAFPLSTTAKGAGATHPAQSSTLIITECLSNEGSPRSWHRTTILEGRVNRMLWSSLALCPWQPLYPTLPRHRRWHARYPRCQSPPLQCGRPWPPLPSCVGSSWSVGSLPIPSKP